MVSAVRYINQCLPHRYAYTTATIVAELGFLIRDRVWGLDCLGRFVASRPVVSRSRYKFNVTSMFYGHEACLMPTTVDSKTSSQKEKIVHSFSYFEHILACRSMNHTFCEQYFSHRVSYQSHSCKHHIHHCLHIFSAGQNRNQKLLFPRFEHKHTQLQHTPAATNACMVHQHKNRSCLCGPIRHSLHIRGLGGGHWQKRPL
jgi:hypothetical protein